MIARAWSGRVSATKADAYHAYLLETGVAAYRATPGNRGVQIFRRAEGNVVHFLMISFWDSLDAVRRFAGADYERAVYYPKDEEFLLEQPTTVYHYEVADLNQPG